MLLREGQLFAGTTWRSILKSKKLYHCLLENPSKDDEMREVCNWLRLSGLVYEVAASIVDAFTSTNQMKMAIYLPSQGVLPVPLEEDTNAYENKENPSSGPNSKDGRAAAVRLPPIAPRPRQSQATYAPHSANPLSTMTPALAYR